MKDSLSHIEISVLARELNTLVGARVDKIYQPSKKQIIINMYHTVHKKISLKILVPTYLGTSEYKESVPTKPSNFVMFLRKYLKGTRLFRVSQPPFERVVELHFEAKEEHYIIICELFSKGNIVICDKDYNIMIPMHSQMMRDRIIRPKVPYQYPPKSFDFEELDLIQFKHLITESERNQIVKALATSLSLGGTYAEELCAISDVNKKEKIENLEEDQYKILFKNLNYLIERANEDEIKPNIILEEGEPIDVQPFSLKIYEGFEKKNFETYTKALDEFFTGSKITKITSTKEAEIDREIKKQETLLAQHEGYLEDLKIKSKSLKDNADLIYQHLYEVEEILTSLSEARDKNIEWPQILQRIEKGRKEGNKEAILIKEVSPKQGKLVLNLGKGIEVDFNINIKKTANSFYNKAKKMEEKQPGVLSAITTTQNKIKELKISKEQIETMIEKELPKKIEKADKEWYEKFYWFLTKEGKLVISGRDAMQNEILIKKYTEPNDIVLHTDAPGSPFTVIKKGKDASEEELREAAIFTLCHSKAWQTSVMTDIYAVNPDQVTKKAPSGESIARGGFMIYGKKNYIKDTEFKFAVGIQLNPLRTISGPADNVRSKAKYYAILMPGDKSKDKIAKEIKEHWLKMASEEDKEIIKKVALEDIKQHTLQNSKIFGL